MSDDINICTLTGRLGQDIDLRYTPSGIAVCSPSLAIGGSKRVGETWEKTVEWVPIVLWKHNAEFAGKYLCKGSRIAVSGRFQTRSWESEGVTKYRSEVIVEKLTALDHPPEKAQHGNQPVDYPKRQKPVEQKPAAGPEFNDSIPF